MKEITLDGYEVLTWNNGDEYKGQYWYEKIENAEGKYAELIGSSNPPDNVVLYAKEVKREVLKSKTKKV